MGRIFNGSDYCPELDDVRLSRQMDKVLNLMIDGQWRTLRQIHKITGEPEASISAQLRHLKKPRFGGYLLDRRRHAGDRMEGLFEYQILPPIPQETLFPELESAVMV